MRVIAGFLRSRTLHAPAGLATRPTSDRLRETLFNVLAPRMEGALFLDLYAGSGAVGIEALSRGAAQVHMVERAQTALKILRANLARLGLKEGVQVHSAAVAAFLRDGRGGESFDVIFLDPPYDALEEYANTLAQLGGAGRGALRPEGLVVAEHRRQQTLNDRYGALVRTRSLRQGDAVLSFYVVEPEVPKQEKEENP